jgi:large subunit ribosomal protein L5
MLPQVLQIILKVLSFVKSTDTISRSIKRIENSLLGLEDMSSISDGNVDIILRNAEVLTNQKAKVLRTRKAVAAFNTKKFNAISSKVTVRGKTLHTFLWFLITVVLPRVSNFKELTRKSLTHDKNSLSLGLSNLALFPQLSKESEQLPKELGITITFNLDPKDSNLLLLLSEYQIPVLIT